MSFKEYWNRVDEKCECCGQVTKKARGFTRQNMIYLIWHKPTFVEVMALIFILLALISSWAYRVDTEVCREMVQRDINYFTSLNLTAKEYTPNYTEILDNIEINNISKT